MKISQTTAKQPTQRVRRVDGRSPREGTFGSLVTEEATGATAAAPTPSLAALGSLLAVQELPDALAERRRAVHRADGLLDELQSLQLGLVEGELSEETIRALAHMLRQPRPDIDDPGLAQVIDDIEVRAAVELAKLERGKP